MLKFGEKDEDEDEDEEEEVVEEKDSDEDEESEDEDEGDEKEEKEEASEEEEVDEERERKREENRRRRLEKKEYKRKKREEELARLEALETDLRSEREEKKHLKEFISKIAERVDSRDMADVDGRMTSAEQRYREAGAFVQQATLEMQKAVEVGDGASFGRIYGEIEKAKNIMQQADNEWRALKTVKEKLSVKEEREPIERQVAPDLDESRMVSYRNEWMNRNAWYEKSNDSEDPDTLAARVIDRKLYREGYKPDTKAYWEEFDRRVRARLPHKFKTQTKKPPQLVGGRESTATKVGSDKEESLDRAFIKVLNERYGRDKNNPDRKKAVASYLQGLKEYR